MFSDQTNPCSWALSSSSLRAALSEGPFFVLSGTLRFALPHTGTLQFSCQSS
jgi:hypothetical protein